MSDTYARIILRAEGTTGATAVSGATGETTTTAETHEATAEHGGHNSFYGNKNELYWGTAAFLIIFGLFLWKGVPAIKKASAARTQRISDEIAAAEATKVDAERELATLKASLGNADADAKAILDEARERAEIVKAELISRSEADIAAAKQRAMIEIAASKQQAFADLQAEVATMTVTATHAVVNANLTEAVKSDLIEQFIAQLAKVKS